MRTGGCTVQQVLAPEALAILKQAVTLAKRRGHAQVTPLHVASTMLSSPTGLLRTACLQSRSHPLQCRALELCFNVALNRIPAANCSPMLGSTIALSHHHNSQQPSISNALVAAFKRAQAHQRRGSIDSQQQPVLAVKIELEQLIISILDDPSVSRVMREAGFPSTQVKSNVEQALSLEICNNSQAAPTPSCTRKPNDQISNPLSQVRDEDVRSVIENLVNKRRMSFVVVGECIQSIEALVQVVIEKVNQRRDVPEGLKEVKCINLFLSSFVNFSRVEVEDKVVELKNIVRGCLDKGIVLYLGDLKWGLNYMTKRIEEGKKGFYCPVEHMIMEIGKLVCAVNYTGEKNYGSNFWLMGIATLNTYMKCKNGCPSLESVWGLHPLTVPACSLRLSLVTNHCSDLQSDEVFKKAENVTNLVRVEGADVENQLTCCSECSANFETEARNLLKSTRNSTTTHSSTTTTTTLPAWLQQYKTEKKGICDTSHQNCASEISVSDLCKKWNSICKSAHHQYASFSSNKSLPFSSISPSTSTSGFSIDQKFDKQSLRDHHHFWIFANKDNVDQSTMNPTKLFCPNPNSNPTSASSSDVMETEYVQKFKELNSDNLKIMCNALEKKVPWQKHIVPEIASIILQCRSGIIRRKGIKVGNNNAHELKEETWLLFQGGDIDGKQKISKELANLVFGPELDDNHVTISLSSFSSTTRSADSTDHNNNYNKRSRDEQSCSYIERLAEAVASNPHRVFFIEDVDQADYCSRVGFKRAMEKGKVRNLSGGEEVGFSDAIIILSCESTFISRSRACSPSIKQKIEGSLEQKEDEKEEDRDRKEEDYAIEGQSSPCVSLDLNISINDEEEDDENWSIDDTGLLESVDRRIVF